MLTVSNLSKQFPGADAPLLKNISFTVNAGERVGLIGANGTGKSTLIQMILGNIPVSGGSVIFNPPNLRIGYLAQGMTPDDASRLEDVLYPELRRAEADVERLGDLLSDTSPDQMEAVLADYGEALDRLEQYSQTAQNAERVLAGLALADVPLDRPVGMLSGGQKTRLGLASILLHNPQLLILDEPTNHLDVEAQAWLADWLHNFSGAVLVVSHDRTFLDDLVDRIVAIDQHSQTARVYEGNYSDYAGQTRSEMDKQWSQWRDQQTEIARLEADFKRTSGWATGLEGSTKPNNPSARKRAKKIASRAKAKEKRLDRYLESDERVDKPKLTWHLKLDLHDLPPGGQDVLFLENLTIGYKTPLLENLNLSMRAGERVVILGANGQGKSTLLKTIIGTLPPISGGVRLGASVKVGYLAQEQEILDPSSTPVDELQKIVPLSHTEARSFLHFFLFAGNDAIRPVRDLSYGERARLMLALTVAGGANLLILDEPINHLDVSAREQFEQALSNFRGSILAVVHDRYFVDQFASTIWHMVDGDIQIEVRETVVE